MTRYESAACRFGCQRTEHTVVPGVVVCPLCGKEYETDGAWRIGSDDGEDE